MSTADVRQVISVPPTRSEKRLRRWAREVALMVLDRIREGGDPHAIWGFGRDVYYGRLAEGVPKRATLIGVYDDRADFIYLTDDIESFLLNAESMHAVA